MNASPPQSFNESVSSDTSLDSSPFSDQPTVIPQSVSGRYEGEMSAPTGGMDLLDLRVDVDERYPNSPVMKRVSGDFFQLNKIAVAGEPTVSRVYRESWIVNNPVVNASGGTVIITGSVEFWKGIHPPTVIKVVINSQGSSDTTASVAFTPPGGQSTVYNCTKKSDCFRDLILEVDVCESVNSAPLLPNYDTNSHPIQPSELPVRILTMAEAYREAGVAIDLAGEPSIIDDSHPDFEKWSAAELHHVMETYFSYVPGPWPQWALWGVLASAYNSPTVGGVMFDAAAAHGGAGSAPERQGFAVFRNHVWFKDLKDAGPADESEAAAARKFLYTWVHEAGHAFNFLHSWNKNRPDALSWMNYDWKYDSRHGEDSFWSNFEFRFDDEELIHLRHGDRSSVIMGGDPWSSGGNMEAPPGSEYLAAPPGAMTSVEGKSPIELLVRSKNYFEFLEPVSIELRLRNLLPNLDLMVDTNLNPEYGGVVIYIRRPDGRIVEFSPIMCKLADSARRKLKASQSDAETGEDRYSEEIPISYGRYGFYFDQPGEYSIRALYQGAGDVLIPSNVHRLRVGQPLTKELDVLAQDYFSYQVGMNLYFEGSRSSFLKSGWNLLREMSERYRGSMLGAKIATVVANSLAQPFFSVSDDRQPRKEREVRRVTKLESQDPQHALDLTESAIGLLRERANKSLNLFYRQLVGLRVECLLNLDAPSEARAELYQLLQHLRVNDAKAPVLRQIERLAETIEFPSLEKPHRMWERVKAQDRKTDNEYA